MSKPTIKITNITTGEEIEREMNAEELAQYKSDQNGVIALRQAEAQKAADKAALLEKLGITEDEAKLLFS